MLGPGLSLAATAGPAGQSGAPVISFSGTGYAGSAYSSTRPGQWSADGLAIPGATGTGWVMTEAHEGAAIRCGTSAPIQLWKPGAAHLPRWQGAMLGALRGTGGGRLLFIGSSTIRGWGANLANTDTHASAIPARIGAALGLKGLPVLHQSVIGTGNMPGGQDARLSHPGDWQSIYNTAGGHAFRSDTASTGELVFAPGAPFDLIRIPAIRWTGYGTLTLLVDDVVVSETSLNATPGLFEITAPVSPGLHVIKIRRSGSGRISFMGIRTLRSDRPHLEILNLGWSGSTSAQWNATTDPFSPLPAIRHYAPSLSVIGNGLNDAEPGSGLTPAALRANLVAIGRVALESGDAALLTPHPGNRPGEAAYIAAYGEAAADLEVPLIDSRALFGTHAEAVAGGLIWHDGYHAAPAGHALYEGAILAAIT